MIFTLWLVTIDYHRRLSFSSPILPLIYKQVYIREWDQDRRIRQAPMIYPVFSCYNSMWVVHPSIYQYLSVMHYKVLQNISRKAFWKLILSAWHPFRCRPKFPWNVYTLSFYYLYMVHINFLYICYDYENYISHLLILK